MVYLEKGVETYKKTSNFKALRHFGATPKPWVAGSSPPAPAKKIKSTFFVGFFFLLGYNLRRTRRGAVVNDSPVDCQSRGRPRSVAKPKSKTRLCVVATRPSPVSRTKPQVWHLIAVRRISSCFSVYLSCGLMICNTLCW